MRRIGKIKIFNFKVGHMQLRLQIVEVISNTEAKHRHVLANLIPPMRTIGFVLTISLLDTHFADTVRNMSAT